MNVQENKWFLKVVIFFLFTGLNSQTAYKYYIDISKINNDEIKVRLSVPELKSKIVRFCFPAMVPGTYSIYDFGRFVKNFNVLDKNKKKISFEKKDVNTFLINDASEISEINYTVEDSWDTKDTGEIIFEPAGTKFDEGKHFILNNQGIFGYIGGMEKIPLEIEVVKPLKFYPATGNSNISLGEKKDVLKFGSYHELVDSPILYSVPDTTTINVAGSKVLIAVVSPSKKINSKFIARTIYDILEAQKNYLGGKLPVEKYAFLFYFTDSITKSGNMGALEHSYSSLYVLYDSDSSSARQMVRDVAAHEFFHIVTPLNIHSEEIGSFDFNNPKMSMHLWLYEGMTEYAAHHVQVMNGLIEPDDFFETIREKMNNSKDYFNDTLSFTNMSKGCLNTYKNQYGNVYEKGALISMCLDILLNYYSNGEYNTRKLMSDLSTKYGKNISFRDEDLFNDIEKLTFREIRIFLDNHVQGNKPLPFQDIFNKVGILFNAELVQEEITLGGFDIGYDDVSQHLVVESTMDINEFGKSMGYKEGDEIIKFRGKEINLTNANEIFYEFIEKAQVGETLEVEIKRKNKKGKSELKKLSSKVIKTRVTYRNVMQPDPAAAEETQFLRNAWLMGNM